MKQLLVFGVVVCIILACTSKNKKQPSNISTAQKTEKKISIEKIGSIEFNKSFSFLQSPDLSKKEIDKLYKETENSNPYKMDTTNENLRKRFEELGIVKDRDLLLSQFKYKSNPEFSFIGQSGKEVKIKIVKDSTRFNNDKIIVNSNLDSSEIRMSIFMELKYALMDVISGGNKDLVILDESYVSNTYIYLLEVFEIKTKE